MNLLKEVQITACQRVDEMSGRKLGKHLTECKDSYRLIMQGTKFDTVCLVMTKVLEIYNPQEQ